MNDTYPWGEKPIVKVKVYPSPLWASLRVLGYITFGVLCFVAACALADAVR